MYLLPFQHQSGFLSPTSVSQPVTLTNSQGLVLIASQSPGGFVLNRISSHPQAQSSAPASSFVNPQATTPGTSAITTTSNLFMSPFTQQSQEQISPSHFTGALTAVTSSAFTQPPQPFLYSSCMATTSEDTKHELQSHQQDHDHKFISMFPTASSALKPFPFKMGNLFQTNLSDVTFKDEFNIDKKVETLNKSPDSLLYNSTHSEISIPTFGNTILRKEPNTVFTWALGKSAVEPSSVFSSQIPTSPSHQAQNLLLQQQSQHRQQEPSEPMAGPSGMNTSVKNMVIFTSHMFKKIKINQFKMK